MTVVGGGMGRRDYSGGMRVGGTACEATAWVSESELQCTTWSAVGRTMTAGLTTMAQTGSLTEAVSLDTMSTEPSWYFNVGSTTASMTVTGSGLGVSDYSGGARVGWTACEATDWRSESTVESRAASGTEGTMRVSVTVGMQVGSLTVGVSYSLPTVSTVYATNQVAVSQTVTVHGGLVGAADYSGGARVGATACEATEWISASAVGCKVGSGVGRTMRVGMTAGVQAGSLTEAVCFDLGYGVVPGPDSSNVAWSISSVTISGALMGSSGYSDRARAGSTACEATDWTSESLVVCRSGLGVGDTMRLAITTGGQAGSLTEALSFDMSASAGIQDPTTNVAVGGTTMTVVGGGMGRDRKSVV